MALVVLPRQVSVDPDGAPRVGANLYFYEAGSSTPIPTYTTPAYSVEHEHPVPSGDDGYWPAIYVNPETNPTFKILAKDVDGLTLWSEDNQSAVGIDRDVIGQVLYPRTASEVAAGVTPADYAYPPYNRSRYDTWANWKAACDQSFDEGVVEGDWTLTANIELPLKSRFTGTISGLYDVLYQRRLNGWIYGLNCDTLVFRGNNFCLIEALNCQYCEIDGYDDDTGTFWNEFVACRIDKTCTIDISNWAVNLNAFRGGRIGYLHITGDQVTYPATQAHANTWDGVDFTDNNVIPSGILQDDTAFEVNFLNNCYYEGGADITGNFHVIGYQGDANGMPAIARYAHIFASVGRNPRTSRDFLSISSHNAARGGCWDWLDSSGKPPCLSHTGGASVSVTTDSTEPCGIGKRYEASFSDAFDAFNIAIQPSGSTRFGVVLFYKSTADFVTAESNDGTGAISHDVTPIVVDSSNNWKMIRICGPASATAATGIALYAYGASGGSAKVMSIGGIFAGGERAVLSPHKNQDYESGRYTPTLTSVTNIAASTAYPMQYSRVGNTVTVCGRIDVDPTAAAPTATEIGISLPIAPTTAFSAADQCMGTGTSLDHAQSGPVLADTSNNRATLRFQAANVANDTWGVSFSYRMG